jgi:hypothetical protein
MRAFELMGQIDIHVGGSDRLLPSPRLITHGDRIGDGFHSDLLDIDSSAVLLTLDIFHI